MKGLAGILVLVASALSSACVQRKLPDVRFACEAGGPCAPDAGPSSIPDASAPIDPGFSVDRIGTGDGRDGPLVVAAGTTHALPLTMTRLTASAEPGDSSIRIEPESMLRAGDAILLLVLQDLNDGTVGQWELMVIASVAGDQLFLRWPLTHRFDVENHVVAQRVPQFSRITIERAGRLTVAPWGDASGGVLAFLVAGPLEVDPTGVITVAGLGYRGGAAGGEAFAGLAPRNGEGARTDENASWGGGRARLGEAGGGGGNRAEGGSGLGRASGGLAFGEVLGDRLTFGGGGGGGTLEGIADQEVPRFGGGHGGGAVFISTLDARGMLGVIDARGGTARGSSGSTASGALSGGGAGGTVLLVSPQLTPALLGAEVGIFFRLSGDSTCSTRTTPIATVEGCPWPTDGEYLLCENDDRIQLAAEIPAAGRYTLEYEVSGTWAGDEDPRLGIYVGGLRVGSVVAQASQPQWTPGAVSLELPGPGAVGVELVFENDFLDSFGHRNVLVRSLTLAGPNGPECGARVPAIEVAGGLGGPASSPQVSGGDGATGVVYVKTSAAPRSSLRCDPTCAPQLPASLIHRWSFASDTLDSVGGVAATLAGGAVVRDGVLDLSGGFGYAQLPIGDTLDALEGFSIEAWARVDRLDMWARIFDFGQDTEVNMFLTPHSGIGRPRFAITVSGNAAEELIDSAEVVSVGAVAHYALVHDPATRTSRLYLDNLLVGERTGSTLNPSHLAPATACFLGHSQYDADPDLTGAILEFRIHASALSPAEIERSYALGPDP